MSDVGVGILAGAVYLLGSGLVFVLGSSYYRLFRTNRSWLFRVTLVAAAAIPTWLLLRGEGEPAFGFLAFGFLAASLASLLGASTGWLHKALGVKGDAVPGLAKAKALEALIVLGSIFLLAWATGVPFSSLYLRVGRLGLGLGVGIGGFFLFSLLAVQQGRQMGIERTTAGRILPWILLFIFSNAFMEELWFRALFFGPLASLTSPAVAIVLTAIVFAVAHIGATYLNKGERARFLVILFVLGLIWGACLHFTGSLIASTIFHAGADLMIVNGFISSRQGRKESSLGLA